MGNAAPSCVLSHAPSTKHAVVVKLVHCNGLVEEFYRPVSVRELSVDYPLHFICHSNDLGFIMRDARPSALSDDAEMELGQIYFLLPKHVLDSPLTQAEVATLFSKAALARKASYKGIDHVSTALPDRVQDLDTTHVTISHDFFRRLLTETRLLLPRPLSDQR